MTRQLPATRDHLATNRRMIIGRSLAAAIAGGVPVPVLEEWMESRIQRGTIRRIAETRGIDLDKGAARAIADGRASPPEWAQLAGGGIAMRLLGRSVKRFMILFLAARRARAAAKHYAVASLFDHYCARRHVGLGLDEEAGRRLRDIIDRSMAQTRGSLGVGPFRRGMAGALRASLRAPTRLADFVTGGRASRLLRRPAGKDEVEIAQAIDTSIERARRDEAGILARMTSAVELELSALKNPYLGRLITKFDELWQEAQPETP